MEHLSYQLIEAAKAGKTLGKWENDKFTEIAADQRIQALSTRMDNLFDACARNPNNRLIRQQIASCQFNLIYRMCDLCGITEKPNIVFYHDSSDNKYASTSTPFNAKNTILINSYYWDKNDKKDKKDGLVTPFHEFTHVINDRFKQYVKVGPKTAMSISLAALNQPYKQINDFKKEFMTKGRLSETDATDKAYKAYKDQPDERLAFATEDVVVANLFPKLR